MPDPSLYLEKLCAFAHALRAEGLTVGIAEIEDACRMLIALGMADRAQVKAALGAIFAKSREEMNSFSRAFDLFFVDEAETRRRMEEMQKKQRELREIEAQAQQELNINGKEMQLSAEQRKTYALMPEEARAELRKFLEQYSGPAERSPELYSNFIHSVFAKALMEEQMRMEDAALNVQALDPDFGLMYRDIGQFRDSEIPKAISIIQDISRRINGELSAKRRRAGCGGKLDFRRTIRKGLETGGSLVRLKYKRKRQRQRHLALLCDVSGSMVQFSEFALRFIQSLNHVAESSRVFLFSEESFEADPFSLQNMDLFRDYVRQSGIYGRGTDLGKALRAINALRPPALNDSTTLLILSDAKSIDQSGAMRALLESKRLAGRVLWLNPIPQNKWRYLKSTMAYASLCTMVSCSTLRALADACRNLAD